MKNNNSKLRKKELKKSLIETIEKALNLDGSDRKMKKLKKTIREAAGQISRKYLRKMKDRKVKENTLDPALIKRRRVITPKEKRNVKTEVKL